MFSKMPQPLITYYQYRETGVQPERSVWKLLQNTQQDFKKKKEYEDEQKLRT